MSERMHYHKEMQASDDFKESDLAELRINRLTASGGRWLTIEDQNKSKIVVSPEVIGKAITAEIRLDNAEEAKNLERFLTTLKINKT